MDFRDNAAKASSIIIEKNSLTPWYELGESLCRPIPGGGNHIQYLAEIPCIIISGLCMLNSIIAPVLGVSGLIPFPLAMIQLGLGFAILLFMRQIKAILLKLFLRSRPDNLIFQFSSLPSRFIGLENSKTVKEVKVVIEDQGVCLFDAENKRILIEGCVFRYIIQAKDVITVKPVSAYALGGADITCKIAGQELGMVLTVAGHGPISSLIESFVPSHGAQGLSAFLISTLFGLNATTYIQEQNNGPG